MANILLVDDEPQILRAYRRVLERGGHSVVLAGDGESAMARIGAEPFDAIVTDVSMPRMNGIEFLRAVRENVKVKGAAPVDVELVFTRHGPVIYTDIGKGDGRRRHDPQITQMTQMTQIRNQKTRTQWVHS